VAGNNDCGKAEQLTTAATPPRNYRDCAWTVQVAARRKVLASIPPNLSSAERKRRLFERLYGESFAHEHRHVIRGNDYASASIEQKLRRVRRVT
jgi:predicted secreted Zn-dependent protease